MKREYTLLILGVLVAIIPWLGLTTSLRQIVFTLLGVWIIRISYKYWSDKKTGKLQKNTPLEQAPLPKPIEPIQTPDENNVALNNEQIINSNTNEQNYGQQRTKPRI